MALGKMFWRKSHKCFYVNVDGKMTRLCPWEEDARKLYETMLAKHGIKQPTIADAIYLYCEWQRKYRSPNTYKKNAYILEKLAAEHGAMNAADFTPVHLNQWVEKISPSAKSTTIKDRMTIVMGVWRWLGRNDMLPKNLIQSVPKPSAEMREFFLPSERWQELLEACAKPSKPIIEFMLRTGARPQEAVKLDCSQWHTDHFAVRASSSKGKKIGRQIFCPVSIIPMVESEIAGRKEGIVFLNSRGNPFDKDSFNNAFRRLKKKLNLPEICAYSMRHSFAADRVRAGVSLEIVAKLLGHSGVNMVYTRYGHMSSQTDLLRNALG